MLKYKLVKLNKTTKLCKNFIAANPYSNSSFPSMLFEQK